MAPIFLLCVLAAASVFSQESEPVKQAISGVDVKITRCRSGCAAGKFKFSLVLFNRSGQKIRIDKNELKYKLRISYKPGNPKGSKKGASQPYKTIAFMQGGGSTEEWVELEPDDFLGFRKEVELGEFDKGLCNSKIITVYGTIQVIGNTSNPELEINQKITGSCSI